MREWIRQNWKGLLIAVGVFVVAIVGYLYLRRRSSGAAASVISFPGNTTPGGSTDGSGAPPAGPPAPGPNPIASLWTDLGAGVRMFTGQGATITEGPGGAVSVYGTPLSPWLSGKTPPPGAIGSTPASVWEWLVAQYAFLGLGPPPNVGTMTGFNPDGTTWTVHFQAPGSGAGRAPTTGTPTPVIGPLGGSGGPGMVAANLQAAAVRAQTRAHQAAIFGRGGGIVGRRWRHDAVQAARESRRIFAESRGAAPVR